MKDETNKWTHVWRVIVGTVVVTVVPWCVWVTSRIHAMDVAVSRLQDFAQVGDRFTTAHGDRLKLEVQAEISNNMSRTWQELAAIKSEWLKELSAINTQIAMIPQTLQIPPKWWEGYVRDEFRKTDERLRQLENK